MAYDKKKIYIQAEEVIEKYSLFFIEDVVAYLPISKTTFYEFYPLESNELNTLKGKMQDNAIKRKTDIRGKLYKSNKASELLALYRMICSDEERKMLNQQYIESRNINVSEPPLFPETNEHE